MLKNHVDETCYRKKTMFAFGIRYSYSGKKKCIIKYFIFKKKNKLQTIPFLLTPRSLKCMHTFYKPSKYFFNVISIDKLIKRLSITVIVAKH